MGARLGAGALECLLAERKHADTPRQLAAAAALVLAK
jgi:hypothetical protein